jgi:hypothetical protein
MGSLAMADKAPAPTTFNAKAETSSPELAKKFPDSLVLPMELSGMFSVVNAVAGSTTTLHEIASPAASVAAQVSAVKDEIRRMQGLAMVPQLGMTLDRTLDQVIAPAPAPERE